MPRKNVVGQGDYRESRCNIQPLSDFESGRRLSLPRVDVIFVNVLKVRNMNISARTPVMTPVRCLDTFPDTFGKGPRTVLPRFAGSLSEDFFLLVGQISIVAVMDNMLLDPEMCQGLVGPLFVYLQEFSHTLWAC